MNENKKPEGVSIVGRVIAGLAVAGVIGLFAFGTFVSTEQRAEAIPNLDLAQALAATNTAGDSVFNTAYIDDATGVVTTPNDAGVFTAIVGSPFTCGEKSGEANGITCSAAGGSFTVAGVAGRGELELSACINNFASSSNVAGVTTVTWYANAAAIAAAPVLKRTEVADAGNTQLPIGCIAPVVYNAAVGDVLTVRIANAGAGITGTTRQAGFLVRKILSK